jgi:hypothetical protein
MGRFTGSPWAASVLGALATVGRVAAFACFALGMTAAASWAGPKVTVPFPVAELFFELNNTDSDLGIHAEIDGEPTKRLTIKSPPRRRSTIFDVQTGGSLRKQGLSFFGFESAEPTFDELAPEEFFARFPEGPYEVTGRSSDKEEDDQKSTVTITHVMPAPPHFDHPPLAPCNAPVIVTAPVTIDWDQVATNHPSVGTAGSVAVERYELAIERSDLNLSFFMELPPTVTEFPVPTIFTDVPGVVKFEVLVKAVGGNRTAEESCFEIQ